ncbi:MAG TPA: Hpt domain-containing protein, partial [Polyangiaceae bacterium]
MTSFTIDDVRDTMPREVTQFLGEIEDSSRSLLAQAPLSELDGWQPIRSLLRTIAARGHAISGTSLLVSANALAACARSIEELAARTDLELKEAQARAERARRTIALIPAGVMQMREILSLELEHQEEEAQWAGAEWQGTVEALLSDLAGTFGAIVKPQTYGSTSIPPCLAESERNPVIAVNGRLDRERTSAVEDAPHDPSSENVSVTHEEPKFDLGENAVEFPNDWSFEDDDVANAFSAPQHAAAEPTPNVADPSNSPASEQPSTVVAEVGKAAAEDEEDEFSFADAKFAAEANTHAGVLKELQVVFQQEARESVVALQGYLASLAADPTNGTLAVPIERIYHTLKGASATVGMLAVSEQAAALQRRSELAAVSGINRPELDVFIRDTNAMLVLAGLDGIDLAAPPERAPTESVPVMHKRSAAERTLRQTFLTEAEQLHQQASSLVENLARRPSPEEETAVLKKLAALAHRLRGSALIASEEEIARLADSLEESCASTSTPTTAALSLGLARIATKLGFGLAASIRAPAGDSNTIAATRAAYEIEARQIVDEALAYVQGPTTTEASVRQNIGESIGHLLHRLQGSALIVGDEAIAQEARSLEQLLAKSNGGIPSLPVGLAERLLELRTKFGNLSSQATSPSEALSAFIPRRERVELTAPDELWETFALECSELLENLERTTLALEDTASPKESLRSLMRLVHTLKGVVNTTGIAPTGRTLHRVEDF